MKNIEINHGILHLPSISPQIIYPHFGSLFETTRFKLVISFAIDPGFDSCFSEMRKTPKYTLSTDRFVLSKLGDIMK